MQAVLYARVSSEEQAKRDLSIPAQLDAMTQWALSHGYQVTDIYQDEGFSAFQPATSRPAFQRMIAASIQAKIAAIIVWKFDRFSRRIEDARAYKTQLAKHGIRVISINEPVDDSPAGFLLERSLELHAELWPRMSGVDIKRGLHRKIAGGQAVSGVTPYGYSREHVFIGGKAVSRFVLGSDEEVNIVRMIFELSLNHYGIRRSCKRLNDDLQLLRRGKPWTPPTLKHKNSTLFATKSRTPKWCTIRHSYTAH